MNWLAALSLASLIVSVLNMPLLHVGAMNSHRGLDTFVKRTFREQATGAMFIAELASRAASMTRRLNELRAIEGDARARASYDALRDDLAAVEIRIAIIFGSAPHRTLPSTRLPADWRRRANEASRHATRLERLIAELLTYDDVWPSDGSWDVRRHPMFAKIDPTLTALWDTVNARP